MTRIGAARRRAAGARGEQARAPTARSRRRSRRGASSAASGARARRRRQSPRTVFVLPTSTASSGLAARPRSPLRRPRRWRRPSPPRPSSAAGTRRVEPEVLAGDLLAVAPHRQPVAGPVDATQLPRARLPRPSAAPRARGRTGRAAPGAAAPARRPARSPPRASWRRRRRAPPARPSTFMPMPTATYVSVALRARLRR